MKSDRPLILSILFLGAGLALIIAYCTGTTSLNAAYPLASSSVHLEVTASGAAALGGLALSAAGVLLLIWAVLAAIVGQISLLAGTSHHDSFNSISRDSDRILE